MTKILKRICALCVALMCLISVLASCDLSLPEEKGSTSTTSVNSESSPNQDQNSENTGMGENIDMDAVKKELETYGDNPAFLGLKFLTGYHGDLLQPEYEYAMDFADEMGCPVLCHEYGNIPDRKEFVEALKTRHNMKLLIAHQGGGFATDTRACAPIIRDHENAYMEICGSLDNAFPVEAIVELAGEDKVIFGTDAINLDPKYELGKVAFSPLPEEIKKKIFAENYLKVLQYSQMGNIIL
jgi:predicted TIM-barrel fold metal-dependent hydrolase